MQTANFLFPHLEKKSVSKKDSYKTVKDVQLKIEGKKALLLITAKII